MTEQDHRSRSGASVLDPWGALWTGAVLVALLAVWWFGTQWFEADRVEARRVIVTEQARQYRSSLLLAIDSRIAMVRGLRAYVERQERAGRLTRATFDAFAEGEYANSPGIRTIQVAPGGVIRWTYPLKGNEAVIGMDLSKRPDAETRTDAILALESTGAVLSGPIPLAQGGRGLVIREAVRLNGKVWGLAAVVSDLTALLAETGIDTPPSDMAVVLWDAHGRPISGDPSSLPPDPVRTSLDLGDGTWRIAVAPRGGWSELVRPGVDPVRGLGLLVAGLVAALVYTAASRQHRLFGLVGARTSELAESVQRYRTLFEESPVSMWEEDFSALRRECDALRAGGVADLRAHLEGDLGELRRIVGLIRIVDVNRASVRLYGARDREQLMEGLAGTVGERNAGEFIGQVLAIADGWTSFTVMTRTGSLDDTRHLAVTWNVVPGHEEYSSVVVCIVDLTDRVRAEGVLQSYRDDLERTVEKRTSELVRVNEELIVAQQAKDAFLASMSHELRTPLNSILGFTGVMLQGAAGPLTEEQRKQLGMVRRSGRELLALVNDVLDLAKLEGGHGNIRSERFELAPLVFSTVDTVRPLADQKGIRLALGFDDAVPSTLHSDPDRLRQILLNLLGNAIKFTDDGEVGLEVSVDDGRECVVFGVSDTGHGIPVDHSEAIFEPFRQLPRDAGADAIGTGLGLAISRDLAVLLGGTLRLVDSDDKGSFFELRLPLAGPPDDGPGS